jgi:perosamine synthetase
VNDIHSLVNKIKKRFNTNILNLHEPSLDKTDYKMVYKSLLEKEISTYGKYNIVFEKKISKYIGASNLVSIINGTSALHLMLKMLGIGKNDEVLVQSLTYISSINSIIYNNAIPHFVEIDKDNLNVDLEKLENYLKNRTFQKNNLCYNKRTKKKIRFFLSVCINGLSTNLIKLKKILKKYNIKLIEDAAEGLGCFYNEKHLGLFGEGGVFSFNGNKIISTGGGGALYLKSRKLYELSIKYATNCKINKGFETEYFDTGYNYRLPSINASLGVSQLSKLEKFIKNKKKIYEIYNEIFNDYDEFEILKPIRNLKSNYWLTSLRVNKINKFRKNSFLKSFWDKNIHIRQIWKPIHMMKNFKHFPKMNLEETEKTYFTTYSLPSSEFIINS